MKWRALGVCRTRCCRCRDACNWRATHLLNIVLFQGERRGQRLPAAHLRSHAVPEELRNRRHEKTLRRRWKRHGFFRAFCRARLKAGPCNHHPGGTERKPEEDRTPLGGRGRSGDQVK